MSLCENDKLYVAALVDQWVYKARKQFYWLERMTKLPNAPTTLMDMYKHNAEQYLERAWELAVHCDVLTDELRFWKAWREEELRIYGEELDKDYPYVEDPNRPVEKSDLLERMQEVDARFTKLGMERSRRS